VRKKVEIPATHFPSQFSLIEGIIKRIGSA